MQNYDVAAELQVHPRRMPFKAEQQHAGRFIIWVCKSSQRSHASRQVTSKSQRLDTMLRKQLLQETQVRRPLHEDEHLLAL